jgi:hypothetical protein
LALSPDGNNYGFFSTCAIYDLKYSNGKVFDKVYSNVDTMTYKSFTENITTCMQTKGVNVKNIALNITNVYPNPITDQVIVESGTALQEINLYTTTGQLVLNISTCTSNKEILDLSNLPPGTYYLKIKSSDKTTTNKLIKH